MKICMVTTSEVSHDTRILNEAESLAKAHKVVILARKYPKQKNTSPEQSRRVKYSFTVKRIDYWRMPFFPLNIFSSLLSLVRAAFKENPDVFHAHDLDGLLCAFPAALWRRKILIYDAHEFWPDTYPFTNLRGIQWLFPLLERLLTKKVSAGITVNETLAKIYSQKYHKKFIAIYNKIKLSSQSSRKSLNLREKFKNQKIVLHLGAADEGRGLEQMIAAAKFLPPNIIIVFLGGGKIAPKMNLIVRENKLTQRIYLLESVPPEQIISTIKGTDLALTLTQKISQSYYYSLPNKIFQYIAAEVPILGSNFPEFKKIILQNNIGEVVDPSKPELIARKIIQMLEKTSQKKYRHSLVGLAKEKYNWRVESQNLRSFYEKI